MFSVDFRRVSTVGAFAKAIGAKPSLIERALVFNDEHYPPRPYVPGTASVIVEDGDLHAPLRLPKRNRNRAEGYREVLVVMDIEFAVALKAFARRLELYLKKVPYPDFPGAHVHGFTSGGSTYENASAHLGARFLLNADIRNFFPSISTARVVQSLVEAGLTEEGASIAARFVTNNGTLPLGFSTSPIISNLVSLNLDQALKVLAGKYDAVYTRYADDLAISSGTSSLPTEGEIRGVLNSYGFELADEKFRLSRTGQRQYVTGLSIADNAKPRVPKSMKRRLRQELYYCRKYGVAEHADDESEQAAVNRIEGRIAYVQGIEPDLGAKLAGEWGEIKRSQGLLRRFPSRKPRAPSEISLVVDESKISLPDGGALFCLGCAELEDSRCLSDAIVSLRQRRLEDPFYGTRVQRFEKKGFHFTDDDERARNDVCDVLAEHPMRMFAVLQRATSEPFRDTYVRLFAWLISRRLHAASGRKISLICDRHDEVGKSLLSKLVEENASQKEEHPLWEIRVPAKRDEPLLCVPDYLLGVLGQFVSVGEPHFGDLKVRRFEQLRDKFRLIRDFDSRVSYNRKRPLASGVVFSKP